MKERVMQSMTPKFGNCLPRQFRRIIIALVAFLLIAVYLSVAGVFGDFQSIRRPTSVSHRFPRKVWQTWKVDPLDFEGRDLEIARGWVSKNPNYRYEVLTDQNDVEFVENQFGPDGLDRLDIVETYRSLKTKIIKADFLRYLVMYVEGGVYTDIDVEALKPVSRFIPDRYNEREIDMVVGIEIDEPDFNNHTILGPKSQSFCQWTFMAKPKLPVMLKLVDNLVTWLHVKAHEQNTTVSEVSLNFDEVITGSGPSAFTNAILEEMAVQTGKPASWDPFHNMGESRVVGNFLVLTVEAFAAGQGHSDSGNHNARTALVKHHYHASGWPSEHPRYTHPVYGSVENCNWNRECVDTWDQNVAEFETLSVEEQAKQISLREQELELEREQEEEQQRELNNDPED